MVKSAQNSLELIKMVEFKTRDDQDQLSLVKMVRNVTNKSQMSKNVGKCSK